MTHYVIIGANAAGLSAAVRIKKQDTQAKITVLEKSHNVSFGACGIPYFIGGEFANIEQMTAREFEDFIKIGIDIKLNHTVTHVNFNQKIVQANLLNHKEIDFHYDKLMIASGARPIIPSIEGLENINYVTMHSRDDALHIKEQLLGINKIAILGAGFIGVEAAEALRLQNKEVHLIDHNKTVLAKTFDEKITEHLVNQLTSHGVNLHLNKKILGVSPSSKARTFQLRLNDQNLDVELLIIATGFRPNTEFLPEGAILCDDRGAIIVNEYGETSIKGVYSAGDCATVPHKILGNRYIPLATTANKLGRLVGDNLAGEEKSFIGTLGACGVRVFDIEVGRVGISEQEAELAEIDYKTVFIKDKNRTDYVPPQTDIYIKLIYHSQSRILLGGQILGNYQAGAIGRVNALSVAIYSQLTVDELGMMDFVYAPPFARTWDALNIAGNVAK
ncbi:CoA-disulfide reductase [Thorsellia kenyensis]|uniref:CoA-disulfide reductase n=1 Tax=Thorsellia kenyensis TaxID=1549888 RepID=A0ABV6CBE8_9GAMM